VRRDVVVATVPPNEDRLPPLDPAAEGFQRCSSGFHRWSSAFHAVDRRAAPLPTIVVVVGRASDAVAGVSVPKPVLGGASLRNPPLRPAAPLGEAVRAKPAGADSVEAVEPAAVRCGGGACERPPTEAGAAEAGCANPALPEPELGAAARELAAAAVVEAGAADTDLDGAAEANPEFPEFPAKAELTQPNTLATAIARHDSIRFTIHLRPKL
jgi:hypothetical protein